MHQAVGLTTHAAVLLTPALGRCLLLVTSQLFVCGAVWGEKMGPLIRSGTLDSQVTVQ